MSEKSFDDKQYVVFTLGQELFGIDINKVKEIIVHQETTQVPGMGYLVEGIINLRGSVIPIYSLSKKFGLPETELTKSTRIVVVEAGGCVVGMTVDRVSEVETIPGEVIEPPSAMVSAIDESFVEGIAKLDEKLVIILDLEKIISR